jgi:hypothetical protein
MAFYCWHSVIFCVSYNQTNSSKQRSQIRHILSRIPYTRQESVCPFHPNCPKRCIMKKWNVQLHKIFLEKWQFLSFNKKVQDAKNSNNRHTYIDNSHLMGWCYLVSSRSEPGQWEESLHTTLLNYSFTQTIRQFVSPSCRILKVKFTRTAGLSWPAWHWDWTPFKRFLSYRCMSTSDPWILSASDRGASKLHVKWITVSQLLSGPMRLFRDQFLWTGRHCTVGLRIGPEFVPQDSNYQRKCQTRASTTRVK